MWHWIVTKLNVKLLAAGWPHTEGIYGSDRMKDTEKDKSPFILVKLKKRKRNKLSAGIIEN